MELITKEQTGEISFNFEEIKEDLKGRMSFYSSLVFTEDQKPRAKKDLAELRKLKKSIDEKKKEVKNAYMKPYMDFESKIKELMSLIDEPITLIDKQVKEFDLKQKEEKKEKIAELFFEIFSDMDIALNNIYKKEWDNVSCSLTKIRNDMEEKKNAIERDMAVLNSFNSDAVADAKTKYLSCFNLAECIEYINNYEKQKAEILKREEEKQLEEQYKSVPATKPTELEEVKSEEPQGFTFGGFNLNQTKRIEISGTAAELDRVIQFLNNSNIEYKEI